MTNYNSLYYLFHGAELFLTLVAIYVFIKGDIFIPFPHFSPAH